MFEFLMAMQMETTSEVFSGVHNLVEKYKHSGLEVVPISEIEAVYKDATMKALREDSLANKILKKEN